MPLFGTLMAAPSLIGNGSFEGTEMQKGANWGTRHQFIRGKGRVEIVEENGEELLEAVEDDEIADAVFDIVMERAEAEEDE